MKTLRQFIEENKAELRAIINRTLNYVPKEAGCNCPKRGTNHYHEPDRRLSPEDLRGWVLNDEGLYNWARSEGVRI